MRDFLIVEIIIPNGQRPGIIQGMLVGDAKRAKKDITTDGYHGLIVGNHKIGRIASATLFLYPEIFRALNIFITVIMPKLSIYSPAVRINRNCHVFQTFSGRELLSSRVTPILRRFRIHFKVILLTSAKLPLH